VTIHSYILLILHPSSFIYHPIYLSSYIPHSIYTILLRCRCDYRRGLNWWKDLLTTYTHDSELQVITAPPLISTLHKSPQHRLSIFQPTVSSSTVPWQRLITVEILQLHALRFYLHSLLCRTQLLTKWVAPIVFKVIPRHGPHRKHVRFHCLVQLLQLPSNALHNTISNSNFIVLEACLPRRCLATAVASLFRRSFPSNDIVCHSLILTPAQWGSGAREEGTDKGEGRTQTYLLCISSIR
jgi:hypothetical protein